MWIFVNDSINQPVICLVSSFMALVMGVLLLRYRSGQRAAPWSRPSPVLLQGPSISEALQAHTHKQAAGLTVLCNPTFHLPSLKETDPDYINVYMDPLMQQNKKNTQNQSRASNLSGTDSPLSDLTGRDGVHFLWDWLKSWQKSTNTCRWWTARFPNQTVAAVWCHRPQMCSVNRCESLVSVISEQTMMQTLSVDANTVFLK